jgi:hypothetical protein
MTLEETKICVKCQEPKPLSDFYLGHKAGREFRYGICRTCYLTRRREQRNNKQASSLLFSRHCGGCGKRISWPSRHRGFVCNTCAKPAVNKEFYISQYMSVLGINSAVSSCPGCAFVQVCQVRVHVGLWVVCEMPDQADLERAALNGVATDGRQITVRKEQVRDPLLWPGWWPDVVEIGEGAPLTVERVNHESMR